MMGLAFGAGISGPTAPGPAVLDTCYLEVHSGPAEGVAQHTT